MCNDKVTGKVGGLVQKCEIITPGEKLKRKTGIRMAEIFENSYQTPGKKRRLCPGEQERPGATLTKPSSRASSSARVGR